jgi:hypothetical protein
MIARYRLSFTTGDVDKYLPKWREALVKEIEASHRVQI